MCQNIGGKYYFHLQSKIIQKMDLVHILPKCWRLLTRLHGIVTQRPQYESSSPWKRQIIYKSGEYKINIPRFQMLSSQFYVPVHRAVKLVYCRYIHTYPGNKESFILYQFDDEVKIWPPCFYVGGGGSRFLWNYSSYLLEFKAYPRIILNKITSFLLALYLCCPY